MLFLLRQPPHVAAGVHEGSVTSDTQKHAEDLRQEVTDDSIMAATAIFDALEGELVLEQAIEDHPIILSAAGRGSDRAIHG